MEFNINQEFLFKDDMIFGNPFMFWPHPKRYQSNIFLLGVTPEHQKIQINQSIDLKDNYIFTKYRIGPQRMSTGASTYKSNINTRGAMRKVEFIIFFLELNKY